MYGQTFIKPIHNLCCIYFAAVLMAEGVFAADSGVSKTIYIWAEMLPSTKYRE